LVNNAYRFGSELARVFEAGAATEIFEEFRSGSDEDGALSATQLAILMKEQLQIQLSDDDRLDLVTLLRDGDSNVDSRVFTAAIEKSRGSLIEKHQRKELESQNQKLGQELAAAKDELEKMAEQIGSQAEHERSIERRQRQLERAKTDLEQQLAGLLNATKGDLFSSEVMLITGGDAAFEQMAAGEEKEAAESERSDQQIQIGLHSDKSAAATSSVSTGVSTAGSLSAGALRAELEVMNLEELRAILNEREAAAIVAAHEQKEAEGLLIAAGGSFAATEDSSMSFAATDATADTTGETTEEEAEVTTEEEEDEEEEEEVEHSESESESDEPVGDDSSVG